MSTAETPETTADTVRLVGQTAFGTRLPGVCLLPRRLTVPSQRRRVMTRLDATRQLVAAVDDEPIVASLGHPAYDLFAAGDRPANFYTWGSMGLASSIGLGLALAQPELRVFVVDGDGSLLMNLGSLATIGWTRPAEPRPHRLGQRASTAPPAARTRRPRTAPISRRRRARWARRATATVTTERRVRRRDRAVARANRARG